MKVMEKTLFSIVIPTYNRAELLKRCLGSVVAQTYQDWEAIIVDNYSEDNTEEVVKSFNEPRFRYIKNHNYGVIAVSRNKALDLAKGNWVCFLDSDDLWYENKLEVMTQYTSKYDLIYHDHDTIGKKVLFFQHKGTRFYEVKESTAAYVLQRGDPFSTSCCCVSTAFLGDTRFDETKALFAVEDYDFFLQLMEKHPRTKKVNQYLAQYDFTTGVSHTRAELDRDRRVFIKYFNGLKREEKRECLKFYMFRKGSFFYRNGDYVQARHYYKIALTSKILSNKKRAFKALILTNLQLLKNR